MLHARVAHVARTCSLVLATLLLNPLEVRSGDGDPATTRPIAGGFDYISNVAWSGGADEALFVLEQYRGVVWTVEEGRAERRRFLEIGDRLTGDPTYEEGLLGLAFPLSYPAVPQVYVSYVNTAGELQISRFDVVDGGQRADPASETPLLRFPPRFHPCGHLVVSPLDGDLYLCLGDTHDNTRRLSVSPDMVGRQGKIMRLDLPALRRAPAPLQPADPEEQISGWPPIKASVAAVWPDLTGRPVVEARGLRNPWHFAIDPERGTMFLPDVGRHHWEEINVLTPEAKIRDHGWPFAEGNECLQDCEARDFAWPVHVYRHDGSRCAIVGGAVYRGPAAPSWQGAFVFGDHCSGEVWALRGDRGSSWVRRLARTDMMLTAIGIGPGGQVVLADGPGGAVHYLSLPDGHTDEGWIDAAVLAGRASLIAQREGFGRLYENQQTVLNSRRWRLGTLASGWYHRVRNIFR